MPPSRRGPRRSPGRDDGSGACWWTASPRDRRRGSRPPHRRRCPRAASGRPPPSARAAGPPVRACTSRGPRASPRPASTRSRTRRGWGDPRARATPCPRGAERSRPRAVGSARARVRPPGATAGNGRHPRGAQSPSCPSCPPRRGEDTASGAPSRGWSTPRAAVIISGQARPDPPARQAGEPRLERAMPNEIAAAALAHLLETGSTLALIDVREHGEYNLAHIAGASSVPRRQLETRMGRLVPFRGAPVIVCDDTGRRAALAALTLERMGYRQVAVLAGGVNRWV